MGYQESFVCLLKANKNAEKNFIGLLRQFEKYNIRTENDLWCECCCKIVLKKDFTVNYSFKTTITKLKAGTILLHTRGERSAQNNLYNFFHRDMNNYSNEELKLQDKFYLIPCENVENAEIIFNNKNYADVIELNLKSECEKT